MRNKRSQSITNNLHAYFPFGFQVSKKAWDRYGMADLAAASKSRVYALRRLADRVNERRLLETSEEPPVSGGEILAMALLGDVLRYLIDRYCLDLRPGSMENGLADAEKRHGAAAIEESARAFLELFPPQTGFLERVTDRRLVRYSTAREMALL